MVAGMVTLTLLQKQGLYKELERKADRLQQEFQRIFAAAEVPLHVNRVGSMMTLFFNSDDVNDWQSVYRSDKEVFAGLFHRMLDEGVSLPPAPFEAMFVSAVHNDADISAAIEAAEHALSQR